MKQAVMPGAARRRLAHHRAVRDHLPQFDAVRDRLPQLDALPHRGRFGAPRPADLGGLALPPGSMPARQALRPLKAWRYVGVYGPELMVCIGSARIGPARQAFWAVWDREAERLYAHTAIGRGWVGLDAGRARVSDPDVQIDVALRETAGIESVCLAGDSYAWTRKQGGIRAHGTVSIGGVSRTLDALAVIDDTAAYYERHTSWRWSAGVGVARDGRAVAWNLVSGVNDPPSQSERTVWIDGEPSEPPPCRFAPDLSAVGELSFREEAVRARRDNMLLVRSRYRQPFGTFAGRLPGEVELADGYGVMEEHDARW
jgi:hypothetical protein